MFSIWKNLLAKSRKDLFVMISRCILMTKVHFLHNQNKKQICFDFQLLNLPFWKSQYFPKILRNRKFIFLFLAVMSQFLVRPALFDLYLASVIGLYLTALYFGILHFHDIIATVTPVLAKPDLIKKQKAL